MIQKELLNKNRNVVVAAYVHLNVEVSDGVEGGSKLAKKHSMY